MDLLFLFAYRHYSICRSGNQYADEKVKLKKGKLSPCFMPYFSKMAQLIDLLSLVGIHPWLLLVLQCLTLSDTLTTSQKRV